ncbi:MAG: hypothetical protein RL076_617 [Chloroflexota bacterium]|jgi:uncharacterized protein YegL
MTDVPNVSFDPTNPDPRCACVLVLDTSGSMHGEKINQLNQGLTEFATALQGDSVAQSRVEIAIVTFGPAQLTMDFAPASAFAPPTLSASGDTPLGAALQQALDIVAMRKKLYKDNGTPYYRPWVFLITDGAPTDNDAWKAAATRIKDEESRKGVAFFAVGVEGADMEVLKQLSSVREPLPLKGYSFREMFVWLSASLSKVSQSQPDQQVPLAPPSGWSNV